ncbi:MAG TPA: hypothetical protein VNK26_01055 [Pyrinomonadaceae bacterium]|nr:hypothetical protein [Pyrinomonadaceae bacterium]
MIFALLLLAARTSAQIWLPDYKPQELSEDDKLPVILKHLPNWKEKMTETKLAGSVKDIEIALGARREISGLELTFGAEAAIASYPAGTLLLIEFPTPQSSLAADQAIKSALNDSTSSVYRRIGNYNAIVFDTSDRAQAEKLLDQIKYEKSVQWLGEDPYLSKKLEKYLMNSSKDMLVSTVLVIAFGLGSAILAGIIGGIFFFRLREAKRAHMVTFSDAGGLTRLNLDGLSEPLAEKSE